MIKSLHLEIIGKGQPLVLLHGWGWNSRIWEPLIPALSENFQLFLIDLPGFGKSPLLTKDYDIETIVSILLEKVPNKSIWLGWSLGGMIAWYIALHYKERVSSLITIASSPKFILAENWPGVPEETLQKFSTLLTQNNQTTMGDFLELQLRGAPKNIKLFESLKGQITLTPHTLSALSGGLNLLRDLDLRSKLSEMQCPSLHLFGSNDMLVPCSVSEKIQSLLPLGECVVIQKAGHIPFLSHQEMFLRYMRERRVD